MIAVLLILVSTAGQKTYASEMAVGEEPEPDANEITTAVEPEDEGTTAAQAGEAETGLITREAGSYIVEAESADNFRYENGHLYVYGGKVSVKTRQDAEYSKESIEVSGYAVLVLDGVRIRTDNGAAIRILPGADAEIRLSTPEKNTDEGKENLSQRESNYVEGAAGYAAVEAGTLPRGDGSRSLLSSLRITGEGSLTAVGGRDGAAIGGSRGQNACGIIVVQGGNIKAIAGTGADAIGCGAQSAQDPAYAPMISDRVSSLTAISDGAGRPLASGQDNSKDIEETDGEQAPQTGNSAPKGFSPASILTASFAEAGDGSLAGLENVRVRATNGQFETAFDMPEGYRSFAVKVEADHDYMIEQGGRSFADAGEENFSGEIEISDEKDILFHGTMEQKEERIYLAPVLKAPAIDVEVTGRWEDDDNRDGTRPGSVIVTLFANGNETGRTVTLSEENDWSGTFDDLPVYTDCIRQSYSVVEGRLEGYTGLISGSDAEGYMITNTHKPLPVGRSSEEEISLRSQPVQKGVIVAKVLTTKVSRTTPVRTSTTIKKSRSAKTGDSTESGNKWGALLVAAAAALYIWMKIEQKRED